MGRGGPDSVEVRKCNIVESVKLEVGNPSLCMIYTGQRGKGTKDAGIYDTLQSRWLVKFTTLNIIITMQIIAFWGGREGNRGAEKSG